MTRATFYRQFSEALSGEMKPAPGSSILLKGIFSSGQAIIPGSEPSELRVFPIRVCLQFMAVVHGDEEQVIRGNAAICLPQLPYQGLSAFGASFLNSFQAIGWHTRAAPAKP